MVKGDVVIVKNILEYGMGMLIFCWLIGDLVD